MPLALPVYKILLEDAQGDTHEETVAIRLGDQLRAELEGPKYGLTEIAAVPMHFTTLWIWAACTREGLTDLPFPKFKSALWALEPVEDTDVDPTQPEADTSSA